MEPQIITIVGGTGFIGRYVVRQLARAGYRLRVIARNPDAALPLKTAGEIGQVVLLPGNLARPETLERALDHSFAVINLVGILFESSGQKFTELHAKGAERLAQMARSARVGRLIHLSALGVDQATGSQYARSKALGEKAVLAAFPQATILRPSVIFGPEDHFFNQFAAMAALSPALPLIGGGRSRFQPVYVGDVARAIEVCLSHSATAGQTYELGGPRVMSFREILEYVLAATGRKRRLLPIPFGIASIMGMLGELLPRPPITRDQVRLLRQDNVVSPGAKNFSDLGITPSAIEIVAPGYLSRFHKKVAA